MFDLKTIHAVLDQLEQEKGIPGEVVIEAISMSLASAYKKEYGKKGQIIRADFNLDSGKTEFTQVKIVVDESMIKPELTDEEKAEAEENGVEIEEKKEDEGDTRVRFNPEQHIMIEDAQKIKKDAQPEDEIIFPLEPKDDFGRIAAQTAKQTIIQKIREAEKTSVFKEFGGKEGDIISGTVQRIERGNIFVDLGRATGILPYEEQIRSERYGQGERIRAYLYSVEESPKGVFLKLSRTHPKFLEKLFEIEAPEIASGIVEIKAVVREAGSRSKVAVISHDEHIDPIGSLVGQRGVRVSTITSELGGEKIDIIEWSEDPQKFIEDSLSPAKVIGIKLDEEEQIATVEVVEDQLSLAIGKGGQNVRLAAKLTGWKIDIKGVGGKEEEKEEPAKEEKAEKKSDDKDKEENNTDVSATSDSSESGAATDSEAVEENGTDVSANDSEAVQEEKSEDKNKDEESEDKDEEGNNDEEKEEK